MTCHRRLSSDFDEPLLVVRTLRPSTMLWPRTAVSSTSAETPDSLAFSYQRRTWLLFWQVGTDCSGAPQRTSFAKSAVIVGRSPSCIALETTLANSYMAEGISGVQQHSGWAH